MNYAEFVESDKYGAFTDFLSVKEAKETGLIPEDYHNIFKDKCTCGSDMIISSNRKYIKCCDPRCPIKLGKMLSKMFDNFGMKSIGDGTTVPLMSEIIRVKGTPTHIAGLQLNPREWTPVNLFGAKGDIYFEALNQMYSDKYSLGDLIANLSIPTLDSSARKIFSIFKTLNSFLDRADGDLRIPLADCDIYDLRVAYYLDTYMEDIKLAIDLFKNNLINNVYGTASLVITGAVSPEGQRMSRASFIKYLNELAMLPDGRQLFGFKECSAVWTCDVIIADEPSNSRKYLAGLERNVLMSSTDYVQLVKRAVSRQKEVLCSGQ